MRSIIIIFSYALRADDYYKLLKFLHFLPNILAVNWTTLFHAKPSHMRLDWLFKAFRLSFIQCSDLFYIAAEIAVASTRNKRIAIRYKVLCYIFTLNRHLANIIYHRNWLVQVQEKISSQRVRLLLFRPKHLGNCSTSFPLSKLLAYDLPFRT